MQHQLVEVALSVPLRASTEDANQGVLRALVFSVWETASRSSALHHDRAVPLGKHWGNIPSVFSFVPHWQGECGSAK